MTTTIGPPLLDKELRLESGDRLSRQEFEQRYKPMPADTRAELIEGVVYMASPVGAISHGQPHGLLVTWLGVYAAATPNVQIFDNTTLRLDLTTEVQPDVVLRVDERHGGKSVVTPDDYLEGAPELLVEVSASTAAYDLHDKLQAYQHNGVAEYLVWTIYPNELIWYRLDSNRYVRIEQDAQGIIQSEVFPGLRLHVEALFAADMASVLATLQRGIGSVEHSAFVQRLASSATYICA